MPVDLLLVEGKLDIEVLSPIFAGTPVVQRLGSKATLPPQARNRSDETGKTVAYVRDRDFDSDPPEDMSRPVVHRIRAATGDPLGWNWCRHEIENYLLEPDFVVSATQCDRASYIEALVSSAARIRWYEISRWVIGTIRRSLPPNYELTTRPQQLKEIALPAELDQDDTVRWMKTHIAQFEHRVCQAMKEDSVDAILAEKTNLLSEETLSDPGRILTHCSGKDLMASLEPWLTANGMASPVVLRNRVRDWMVRHPGDVSQQLPEWQRLVETVRG